MKIALQYAPTDGFVTVSTQKHLKPTRNVLFHYHYYFTLLYFVEMFECQPWVSRRAIDIYVTKLLNVSDH